MATHLRERGLVNDLQLVSLLGPERHAITVKGLENALIREAVVNEHELSAIIHSITGTPVFTGTASDVSARMNEKFAWQHGALLLTTNHPDGSVQVALVEDTEANVDAVHTLLPDTPITFSFVTASRFADVFRALYRGGTFLDHPPAPDLFVVLDAMLTADADDLHIAAGLPPRIRVHGHLDDLPFSAVSDEWIMTQVAKIAADRNLAELRDTFSTDLAYSFGPVRFRINIARDSYGTTMALRRLPNKLRTAQQLGLPSAVRKFVHLERGLILVTGPTGSGKTTTLAAILAELCTQPRHIITLEDPIEYRLPRHLAAQVNQREKGSSLSTFPLGLRDGLRQDPDVLLVGEMRDRETISTAITACETGHLVLGTLHTFDAANTIARIVDTFPAGEQDGVRVQLSQLLRGIVSQTLLARAGESGRVAAFEILLNTASVAPNLKKPDGQNAIKETMRTSGRVDGMCTMEYSLASLVVSGQVTKEEALFKARDPKEFTEQMHILQRSAEANRGRDASKPYTE